MLHAIERILHVCVSNRLKTLFIVKIYLIVWSTSKIVNDLPACMHVSKCLHFNKGSRVCLCVCGGGGSGPLPPETSNL